MAGEIQFFNTCCEIIKCLPALSVDRLRPTDCATEPHHITHAPDALRGFAIFFSHPREPLESKRLHWTSDMWEDYNRADGIGREYLKKKYGEPN